MDTLEEKVRWTREIAKTHDPLLFYEEHYTGITRGILQKENKSLYNRLERDGLLHRIPAIPKADFGEDPVAYYHQNYEGLTRGQVKKENPSLYTRLQRDKLLDKIPLLPRAGFGEYTVAYYQEHYNRLRNEDVLKDVPLAIHDFGKNAFEYYKKHFNGVTRGKLKLLCPSLYTRLRK